jgi:ABC-type branched-subunit amino acid transport system substrate-binding protein
MGSGLLWTLGATAAVSLGGCAVGNPDPNATAALGSAPKAGGGAPAPRSERQAVKVALLLPLTGSPQTAVVAKAMREAAELALFDQREGELQLVVKDDRGSEDGARQAAEEAIAAGAEIILGPLFSRSVKAAATVARRSNIPVVAFSNDPGVAGNGVYLLSFSPAGETVRIVEHTVRSGRRRIGALLPDDAEGKVIEPAFRAAVERAGAAVSLVERYTVESSGLISVSEDLRTRIMDALASEPPLDALLVPGSQETLPQTATLLTQAGLDIGRVKLIGTGGWNYPGVEQQQRLAGGWFVAPDPRGWSEFAERYGRAYKSMPPRIASLAHDAVLMAGALSAGAKGNRFTAAAITRSSGFTGADGLLRFGAGGLAERALAVLECQKSGPVVIDRPGTPTALAQTAMSAVPERAQERSQ